MIESNLSLGFGRLAILTILSLLIHEPRTSPHLLITSELLALFYRSVHKSWASFVEVSSKHVILLGDVAIGIVVLLSFAGC